MERISGVLSYLVQSTHPHVVLWCYIVHSVDVCMHVLRLLQKSVHGHGANFSTEQTHNACKMGAIIAHPLHWAVGLGSVGYWVCMKGLMSMHAECRRRGTMDGQRN